MRKILLFLIILLITSGAFSQNKKDFVYLKNGSVIIGTIIQEVQYDQIIIRTDEGYLLSFKYAEIEKVLQTEDINLDQYGGNFSYGVALGGAGVIGVPIRLHLSTKSAFEIGAYYRPAFVKITEEDWYDTYTDSYYLHSCVIFGGWNFYLGKYFKIKKQKIKLNGIAIKGGFGFGDYSTYLLTTGWIHESFKKRNTNHSFSLELGPGLVFTDNYSIDNNISTASVAIYWKAQWNWHN
ncbi:MAG: hypothetical protein A2W99_10765 [Bacteroidetes bacterium GWF2_33_16]|nr:MAG: hypothetical protein A2X00_04975 [Bacteroidetes bacterium GWE2_32_14]OFY04020.1 MAG: hypothetical protein A2W99_10765 [Bacteroidetes bacterium GWF2_33_16]